MNEVPTAFSPCSECNGRFYHQVSCSMYEKDESDAELPAKIGCIVVLLYREQLLGIQCAKGRGFLMAGGKWKGGETFRETAARELEEEIGLVSSTPLQFLYSGMSEEGYYTYSFIGYATEEQVAKVLDSTTEAGKVRFGTWDELKQSKFRGYYDILEEVIKESLP